MAIRCPADVVGEGGDGPTSIRGLLQVAERIVGETRRLPVGVDDPEGTALDTELAGRD